MGKTIAGGHSSSSPLSRKGGDGNGQSRRRRREMLGSLSLSKGTGTIATRMRATNPESNSGVSLWWATRVWDNNPVLSAPSCLRVHGFETVGAVRFIGETNTAASRLRRRIISWGRIEAKREAREMAGLETVEEDVDEYNYREVVLPALIPVVPEPELERETGERRRGRDLLVAVDFGPNSRHAFDWALVHLCRLADTLHLVHAVSSVNNDVVYDWSRKLMEDLAVEAFKVSMVRTKARIVEGDAGKAICREAERLKPAAVIMGTRGRSLIQSVLQGSVSEYCFHHCKAAPVIVVPGKDAGEQSVI